MASVLSLFLCRPLGLDLLNTAFSESTCFLLVRVRGYSMVWLLHLCALWGLALLFFFFFFLILSDLCMQNERTALIDLEPVS